MDLGVVHDPCRNLVGPSSAAVPGKEAIGLFSV